MRKVKLLTSRVLGSGQVQEFGEIVELPAAEAEQLVSAGQAVPADEPSPAASGRPSRGNR
jgi:hypothetical protein